jgi:hypothetical protein
MVVATAGGSLKDVIVERSSRNQQATGSARCRVPACSKSPDFTSTQCSSALPANGKCNYHHMYLPPCALHSVTTMWDYVLVIIIFIAVDIYTCHDSDQDYVVDMCGASTGLPEQVCQWRTQ